MLNSTDDCQLLVSPVVIPGATGVVYAPVRAYVNRDLWEHLPEEFLNSAFLSNRKTEELLESMGVTSITTTIVGIAMVTMCVIIR